MLCSQGAFTTLIFAKGSLKYTKFDNYKLNKENTQIMKVRNER